MQVFIVTGDGSAVGRMDDTPVVGVFTSSYAAEMAVLKHKEQEEPKWWDDVVDPPAPEHRLTHLLASGYTITTIEVDRVMAYEIRVRDLVGQG